MNIVQRIVVGCLAFITSTNVYVQAQDNAIDAFAFFRYVHSDGATMVAYTPSELDPRNPDSQVNLPTSSIRADLTALRPAFDGLVTYGYDESSTPRILAVAKELKYRAVMLGVWQPKSADEIDGVAKLITQYKDDFALAVVIGNEGLIFKRYEEDDLRFAQARLRKALLDDIPLTTTEPLVGYESEFVRDFGDFLAPNIHPVFDAPELDAVKAVAWANEHAVRLAKEAGKPVVVKETGFPHAGKEQFTLESQRDFWTAFVDQPLLTSIDGEEPTWIFRGVAFEAFDLHWKSEASGTAIERSWGLMSRERKPYPAFDAWQKKGVSP